MAREGLAHARAVSGDSSGGALQPEYLLEEERQREALRLAALPALSRDDVLQAVGAVLPLARRCYQRMGGVVVTRVNVAVTGRVSTVAVVRGAELAGARTTECLERALKEMRFPPSRGLTFEWPFTP